MLGGRRLARKLPDSRSDSLVQRTALTGGTINWEGRPELRRQKKVLAIAELPDSKSVQLKIQKAEFFSFSKKNHLLKSPEVQTHQVQRLLLKNFRKLIFY